MIVRIGRWIRIVLWRWKLWKIRPKVTFEESSIPSAPDYSQIRYWAAHPLRDDKSNFRPKGVIARTERELKADVFFIHPTTYFGLDNWNASFDHFHANEIVDEMVIPGQASVFSDHCRVFAPRYRQANFHSFLDPNEHSRKALELAYEDVVQAFNHYIQNWNEDRPFFIAAHSQGSLHAMRLLEERIDRTSIFENFIAAYIPGFQFPRNKFRNGDLTNIQPAQSAFDIHCILSWDTYAAKGRPFQELDRVEIWYGRKEKSWVQRVHEIPFCINPMNWQSDTEEVPRNKNKGAVHVIFSGHDQINWKAYGGKDLIGLDASSLSAPYPKEVSSRIHHDGFLYVSWPLTNEFTKRLLPGFNFHNHDYALFYMNIVDNIGQRLNTYLSERERIKDNKV